MGGVQRLAACSTPLFTRYSGRLPRFSIEQPSSLGLGLQHFAEIAEVLNESVRQRVCVCPRDGEKQQIFQCLVFG